MVQLERKRKSNKVTNKKTNSHPNKSSKKYNKKSNSGLFSKKRKKQKSKKKKGNRIRIILFLIIIFGSMMFISSFFEFIEYENNPFYQNNEISHSDFISKIEEPAIVGYRETGVLPSVTIAQAILESNWGKSRLAREGNNLFGIKADSSWKGKKINFNTKEYYNLYERANFRRYDSWSESVRDYHNFLSGNSRYKKHGLFKARTYREQAQALENAGYATTINSKGERIYADKIISVIESRKLYEIDKKVKGI